MLVIRMQRTGRSGHAQFRVVVQDSRTAPSSGRVVAQVGSYNPHTKEAKLDVDKISFYLKNGARPSDRAARLFKAEKVKLPDWFALSPEKKTSIKNAEKLRRNRPAEETKPEPEAEAEGAAEAPAETATEEPEAEQPTEETPAEEQKA